MLKYAASLVGAFLLFVGLSGIVADTVLNPVDDAATVVRVSVKGGHGTGFSIGNHEFLTAGHVAKEIGWGGKVTLSNPQTKAGVLATVVWIDEDRDVALLRTEGELKGLQSAKLSCDQRDPVVGVPVHSIGYPLDLGLTETWGHVAAKASKNLQTMDLTLAPGNSGGPVFDDWHEVIGMSDAITAQPSFLGILTFPFGILVPRSSLCDALHSSHVPPPLPEAAKPKPKKTKVSDDYLIPITQ